MGAEDRVYHPEDPEYAFIGLASHFTTRLPQTVQGYIRAIAILQEQHQKIMPKFAYDVLKQSASDSTIVDTIEQMASLSISSHDYSTALDMANYLYILGDIDQNENLGNHAFEKSFAFHKTFGDIILHEYSSTDPYLQFAGAAIMTDITKYEEIGNDQEALNLLRGLIHTVALNGTLGKDAKSFIDPMAIVSF